LVEHKARIVTARPLGRAAHSHRRRRETQSIGNLATRRAPRWLTTPSHSEATVTRLAARIFFISEVPSWVGMALTLRQQHPFPLLGDHCRGCAAVTIWRYGPIFTWSDAARPAIALA
jgi:hypothetical protein